ncbi:MAG: kynureninase [Fimbriimonas sp.]|nr:kynureninase [Fimbriimonas sp.]
MNPPFDTESLVAHARGLDAADPLRSFRDAFVVDDPELIYLDGNSLGRLPIRTDERVRQVVSEEWGTRLVNGWGDGWIDLPRRLGGKIAGLIGALPEEVIVCDSTSVNLYKLAMAALDGRPGRSKVLTDASNFPSDVYILAGCAAQTGRELIVVEPDELASSLDRDTALVSASHVAFKSGAIADMVSVTDAAHTVGALTLWDLSHSVGALPINLNAASVDLAIGCTYKYLNGGPGSPAFLFVRKELQDELVSPIRGWFGQADAFAFGLEYTPAPGLDRFLAGTPPILSMAAIEAGVDLVIEVGIDRLRAKSVAQTEFLVRLWQALLEPLQVSLNSPVDPGRRGSHVSIGHPNAFQIDQALIHEKNVIPDFRCPDSIRFGVTPLYTTFEQLAKAILRTRSVIEDGSYRRYSPEPSRVT